MAEKNVIIPTRDHCLEQKQEIDRYVGLFEGAAIHIHIASVKNIAKKILFLKEVLGGIGKAHYSSCFIYDSLLLMHVLSQKSHRIIYVTYRSFIENFFRIMLQLEDEDRTGVCQLIELMKNKYTNPKEKGICIYLSSEYSECCNFVHSNIKAEMNIYEYYKDIITSDEIDDRKMRKIINRIMKCMNKVVELIILTQPQLVDRVFYRRKQQLKYLIGEGTYHLWVSEYESKC